MIVVCLNPGDGLRQTLDSILSQTYSDYEIIVKDGGSKDGSIEAMPADSRIRLYREKDGSIYEAMNQAVAYAEGEYILFLNCGDIFYNAQVLEKAAKQIEETKRAEAAKQTETVAPGVRHVFYGDTFGARNQVTIASAPQITGFTCYRNIPCHQVCFYEASLCKEKPYDLQYRIRADYDHFLWCYYRAKAQFVHLGMVVASYEGGGFSEKKENVARDKEEHSLITRAYMSGAELLKYRGIMLATLGPLRSFLAEKTVFSGVYHKLKKLLYR